MSLLHKSLCLIYTNKVFLTLLLLLNWFHFINFQFHRIRFLLSVEKDGRELHLYNLDLHVLPKLSALHFSKDKKLQINYCSIANFSLSIHRLP